MALVDYKIVRFSHEKRHAEVTVRVYRGAVTTEQEPTVSGLQDVTRYRRALRIGERTFSYDVPRDMTRDEFLKLARAFLNNKFIAWATANGHTIINEQQDTTDLEPIDNETEI